MEDDITASVVVPGRPVRSRPPTGTPTAVTTSSSRTASTACSSGPTTPSTAASTGRPKRDMARPDNFLSNFEPLTAEQARPWWTRSPSSTSTPRRCSELLREAAADSGDRFVVSSAYPRLVDGKPRRTRATCRSARTCSSPMDRYIAERGIRLARGIPADKPLPVPVGAVLIGRRNNPPDRSGRASGRWRSTTRSTTRSCPNCSWISSARSPARAPSTTGAGSEGALTKGPFNALRPIVDLNTALVSTSSPAWRGSPPRRDTSARRAASITTSACSSPRSGAG